MVAQILPPIRFESKHVQEHLKYAGAGALGIWRSRSRIVGFLNKLKVDRKWVCWYPGYKISLLIVVSVQRWNKTLH